MATALYLLSDTDRDLIYAGITDNLRKRFAVHKCKSEWWPEVVYREVVWYPTRESAEGVEGRIIEWASPRWNTSGPGRQRIGMTFPQDTLARVDAAAEVDGISRAEKIRRLVAAGLA